MNIFKQCTHLTEFLNMLKVLDSIWVTLPGWYLWTKEIWNYSFPRIKSTCWGLSLIRQWKSSQCIWASGNGVCEGCFKKEKTTRKQPGVVIETATAVDKFFFASSPLFSILQLEHLVLIALLLIYFFPSFKLYSNLF